MEHCRMELESKIASYRKDNKYTHNAMVAASFEAVNIKHYLIAGDDIRKEWIILPKALAMYILYANTNLSFRECGHKIGAGWSHSTVLSHVRRIQDMMDTGDEKTISVYERTRKILAEDYNITIPSPKDSNYRNKIVKKENRMVKQFDHNGNYVGVYDSADQAAAQFGINRKNIIVSCNAGCFTQGYFWQYADDDGEIDTSHIKQPPVYQLDLSGEIIAEFKNAKEASAKLGYSPELIYYACTTGRRAGDHRFKYVKDKHYKVKLANTEKRELTRMVFD